MPSFLSQIIGKCPDCCTRPSEPAPMLVCRSWSAGGNVGYTQTTTYAGTNTCNNNARYAPWFTVDCTQVISGSTSYHYDASGSLTASSGYWSDKNDCVATWLSGEVAALFGWERFYGPDAPAYSGYGPSAIGVIQLYGCVGSALQGTASSVTVGDSLSSTTTATYPDGSTIVTVMTFDSSAIEAAIAALPTDANGTNCSAYAYDAAGSGYVIRSQAAVQFQIPVTCYLKVWFSDTTVVTGGATTVVDDPIEPYEWSAVGCDPGSTITSDWLGILNEPSVTVGQEITVTRSIRKWSCVVGYVPDDDASQPGYSGLHPNGFPL